MKRTQTEFMGVDLVKALDTVNRQALVAILKKMGVPNKLAALNEQPHTGVEVKFKIGPQGDDVIFQVTIGVKQGDNMAPMHILSLLPDSPLF